MVTAGKARKFSEPDDERVSTRRNLEAQYGLGRGNDNQVGAQQFSGQEGFTPITQSGLEDPTKVQVRGSQMSGALGFS
ncbi:hypothetical protein IIB34_02210, partial [PVC group bacterium]|nr:hypothetical protein [PVC group bacterium]